MVPATPEGMSVRSGAAARGAVGAGGDEAVTGHLADMSASCRGRAAGYGEAGRQAGQGECQPPLGRRLGGRCCCFAYSNVCLEAAESAHRTVTLATAGLLGTWPVNASYRQHVASNWSWKALPLLMLDHHLSRS